MNILKKIVGVLLLVIAGLLTLSTLYAFIDGIVRTIEKFKDSGAYGVGSAIGTIIASAFFIFIIIYITKKGLKLISNKNKTDSIDDIGTEI